MPCFQSPSKLRALHSRDLTSARLVPRSVCHRLAHSLPIRLVKKGLDDRCQLAPGEFTPSPADALSPVISVPTHGDATWKKKSSRETQRRQKQKTGREEEETPLSFPIPFLPTVWAALVRSDDSDSPTRSGCEIPPRPTLVVPPHMEVTSLATSPNLVTF